MHILFYGHRMEITLAKWEMDTQRDNEKKIRKKNQKKLQSNNIKETTKQN